MLAWRLQLSGNNIQPIGSRLWLTAKRALLLT